MSFNCYYIRTADFTSPGGGQGAMITRDNYEAYLVMYVDDELSAKERRAVEQFIQQHPDLKEELGMLQQSVLRADEAIVFEQKESLFRNTTKDGINELNCEAYFVLYGDGELTNEEKDKVEQFIYKHPQYQADFELIQQVKLVPDNTLTFPDKTYLYRPEEEDNRVIAFPWWRFTAAAIALLTIGSLAWYITTHNSNQEIAGTQGKIKSGLVVQTPQQVDSSVAAGPLQPPDNAPAIIIDSLHILITTPQPSIAKSNQQKNISEPSNIQPPSYVQYKSDQQPEDPAGENEKSLSAKSVVVAVNYSNERPVVKSAVIKNTIAEPIAVNTVTVQPEEEPDQSQTAVLTASVNKTPLRGFFRKVSRVVDKVTSPNDNGKGGIRIANLAFSLK